MPVVTNADPSIDVSIHTQAFDLHLRIGDSRIDQRTTTGVLELLKALLKPESPTAPKQNSPPPTQSDPKKTVKSTRRVVELTQTIEFDPCNADLYAERGVIYLAAEDWEAAELDFRAAWRWRPNHSIALVGWADAAQGMENDAEAVRRYDQAIKAAPQSAFAFLNRGKARKAITEAQMRNAASGRPLDPVDAANVKRHLNAGITDFVRFKLLTPQCAATAEKCIEEAKRLLNDLPKSNAA